MINRLKDIQGFLLDMDGTFFLSSGLSDRLLPGAAELVRLLEQRKIPFLFLTNNSSRTRREYAEKIRRLGVEITEERIFTSGEATAIYLNQQKPEARLYVVGTPALEREFQEHGFHLVVDDPDYAVLGFDTTLTYAKISHFCRLVATGIPYIATHPDINCPVEDGFIPDIGAMMALIAASTGRQPDVIIGKPNRPIVDALAEKLHLPVSALCMVGDRLYTDIALGQTGLTTVLVLSGETHREDLPGAAFHPDFVMRDLAELVLALQSADMAQV
jgi:HAD superfamily hydrolase (TIGR01457 family)